MSNPANFQPQIPSTVRGPWVHTFVPPTSRMSCFNSSTHTCGCGCVKTKVKGPTCVWPPWPMRATSPPPFCGVPVSPGGYRCVSSGIQQLGNQGGPIIINNGPVGRCVGSGIQQLGNQGGPIIINNGPVATGGHLHQGQGCGRGGIASANRCSNTEVDLDQLSPAAGASNTQAAKDFFAHHRGRCGTASSGSRMELVPADPDISRMYEVQELDGNWTRRSRYTIDSKDIGQVRWYQRTDGTFFAKRLPSG
ncbi:hypothetical protein V498_01693 [Pseudogymnoascus sp. VKM F-4517 (FW-2822)]|nr:hypothetical protein V498_01693 [Pseudogymnoascus sp. VKM F-4517 (FW-2822)]